MFSNLYRYQNNFFEVLGTIGTLLKVCPCELSKTDLYFLSKFFVSVSPVIVITKTLVPN